MSDLNVEISAPICEFTNITQSACKANITSQFHQGEIECHCAQRCDEIYYSGKLIQNRLSEDLVNFKSFNEKVNFGQGSNGELLY